MGWFAAYSFTSDGGKIRFKDGVSIKNVIVCDRAVLQHVETYQGLEIALRWAGDHPHEAASMLSILDLFFGETLKILTDGVHIKRVVVGGNILVVGQGSIDKEDSCLRVGIEVHIMEAIGGRAELNNTPRCGNDKHTIAVLAVVGDGIFAAQMVE